MQTSNLIGAADIRQRLREPVRGREEELLEEMEVTETKMKSNGSKSVWWGRCIVTGIREGRAKAKVKRGEEH